MLAPSFRWSGICLTPLVEADVQTLNRWQNDLELQELTMGFHGSVSEETTAAWLRALSEPPQCRSAALPTRIVFGIRNQAVLIGTVQLHSIDWVQRAAMLGVTIADAQSRGKGNGFAATTLLLDYAFVELELRRVALSVMAPNKPACQLYERLGFTREGILQSAYFAFGERHDVALYGMLHEEWRSPAPGRSGNEAFAPT